MDTQAALDWLLEPAPYTAAPWAAVIGLAAALVLLMGGGIFVGIPRFRAWWNDDTPRPGEDERGVSTEEMTLIQHLLELRTRLVRAAIGLAAGLVITGPFFQYWFDLAIRPAMGRGNCGPQGTRPDPGDTCLQAISPTEQVFAYFKVTLVLALILAMPIIVHEIWKYVAPGLTRQERKWIVAILPGATLLFTAGVSFAYFGLLPPALGFLLEFGTVRINPTVDSYISFFWRLTVAIGLVFQLPLLLFVLAKLKIVNPKMLGSIRRYVVVGAFIVAAIVTPTPDPFNQILVVVPILVLYEVGALLTRFA
ncbi:MAG TPA: twin-arginine translocase subunit TatC [Chloroflexota bacterium]|nr:twin-arginine translocase subunit TatC [Chloroflexota bacterium]